MADIITRIEQEIPKLRRYARALTRDPHAADDLVQDALARALGKAHLWQEGTNLRAWLFTILHNEHVNQVRRRVREGTVIEISDFESGLNARPSQLGAVELKELERALQRLPAEQRQVILLIGLEGMAYEEVATIMNVPVGTIRSRLSRGRNALRALMDQEHAEHGDLAPISASVFRNRARIALAS